MRQSLSRSTTLPDPEATERLGSLLAQALPESPGGWIILLKGELGSGKSTLARAMLREFGQTGSVPSPTYTLVEPYEFPAFSIYHIDLYRVKNIDELEFLGWPDLADGLCLVEWPERVAGLSGQADLQIGLHYDGTGRSVELTGLSERGAKLIAGLPFD